MEPTESFDKHVLGLFKCCNDLLIKKGDRKHRGILRNCNKRYNRNKSDFSSQFLEIFNDYNMDILSGREDSWLREEKITFPYNKENVKNNVKFDLSHVYGLAKKNDDHQLAIQYHLYWIFQEIVADEDNKSILIRIRRELGIELGADSSSEYSSEDEDDESHKNSSIDNVLNNISLSDIGDKTGDIIGKIMGSLSELGLDLPEGTTLPIEEIQNVIHTVTNDPKSADVMKKIVGNLHQGGSIDSVIKDPDVQGLLKDTLAKTAKMARSKESVYIETEIEDVPKLMGPEDFPDEGASDQS